MQIKKLKLENFRGIEEIEIELLPNMNVFVGINGAGKSTILDAIAISLSWLVNRIQKAESKGMTIPDESIRNESNYSSITIDILENNQIYNWKNIEFNRGYPNKERLNIRKVNKLAYYYQEKFEKINQLPMIAYYPINRVAKGISALDILGNENISQLDVYDNALGSKANFQAFFEWFRLQDDIINEESQSRTKYMKENKNLIHNIMKIIKLLNSVDTENKLTQIRKNDFIDTVFLEEPKYLFFELMRSIRDIENQDVFFLENIEYLLYQMSTLLSINKKSIIQDNAIIQEQIHNIFEQLIHLQVENNSNEKNKLLEFIWSSFRFSLRLTFWWFSNRGKKELENILKYIRPSKRKFQNNTVEFMSEIGQVIKKNIQRLEQALSNNGRELKFVTETIEKFIPEYSNLRVTRIPTPHMLVEKNGETIRLDQLSDGEKNMIAMVGDIARRLSMANPSLNNPLEGDGIVMIDEVDLHLHPKWQQRILVSLEEAFPNIQFIVTTHSPQVLTTVKSKGIQGLVFENHNLEIKKFDFSLGAKSHELLYEILGVTERPQNIEIVKDLNKYLELVDENLYNDEEAIKLREKLDAWGAGKEKDLLKADMDIRLKEYRRKKYEKS